jgi:hypothetical protein
MVMRPTWISTAISNRYMPRRKLGKPRVNIRSQRRHKTLGCSLAPPTKSMETTWCGSAQQRATGRVKGERIRKGRVGDRERHADLPPSGIR